MLAIKLFLAKILGLLVLLGMIFSAGCERKDAEKDPSIERRPQSGSGLPDNSKFCKSMETVQISADGNTAISRLKDNARIAWDIHSKEIKAERLPFNFLEISPDSRFLLTKISNQKFQVLKLERGFYRYKATLKINSWDTPEAKFSWDSKLIVFRYKSFNASGMERFDLYDMDRGEYLKSFGAIGIKFIQTANASKSVVIGYDNGFEKYVAKYNIETLEEQFKFRLPPYQPFTYMQTTGERIVVRSRNTFYIHSLATGEKLFQANYKHIHEADHKSGVALVTKNWQEVTVVNLKDGQTVFNAKKPDEIILSTCRIKNSSNQIVCKDRISQNKVFVWDMDSGESVSTCY